MCYRDCPDFLPFDTWTVIVTNIGQVYDGTDEESARDTYWHYVDVSKSGAGRAGNEQVTLCRNGEPLREYTPPDFGDDCDF